MAINIKIYLSRSEFSGNFEGPPVWNSNINLQIMTIYFASENFFWSRNHISDKPNVEILNISAGKFPEISLGKISKRICRKFPNSYLLDGLLEPNSKRNVVNNVSPMSIPWGNSRGITTKMFFRSTSIYFAHLHTCKLTRPDLSFFKYLIFIELCLEKLRFLYLWVPPVVVLPRTFWGASVGKEVISRNVGEQVN